MILKRSAHPNIVPLLGVTIEPLELISDWMPGGDLPGYIAKHPNADRLSLVGTPSTTALCDAVTPHQLSDVAEGLNYLHSCDVIHGDLKGVCDRSRFRLPPHSRPPSRAFSWTRPTVHESQILVLQWSPEVQVRLIRVHDGSRQRSWEVERRIARRQIFSHSLGSRSRSVTDN